MTRQCFPLMPLLVPDMLRTALFVHSGTLSQRWMSTTDPSTPSRFVTSWSPTRTTGYGLGGSSVRQLRGSVWGHRHSNPGHLSCLFANVDCMFPVRCTWSCGSPSETVTPFPGCLEPAKKPSTSSTCRRTGLFLLPRGFGPTTTPRWVYWSFKPVEVLLKHLPHHHVCG